MELRNENLQNIINEGVVLVDFFATWCGPCKMQATVLKELEDKVKIVKVDVDEHPNLAQEYGVMSIPTLFLFENGELKHKKIGFASASEIISWL